MLGPILLALLEICCLLGLGWLARQLTYIREMDLGRWSSFVFDFLFPPLLFHTIVVNLEVERIPELWPLPLLGIGMMGFGAAAGFALHRGLSSKDNELRKTFRHFCAVNNYGLLPVIIIARLWGPAGVAKLFVLNLGSNIGFWTIGVALLSGGGMRKGLRNMINPPVITIVLALVVALAGWGRYVPEFLLTISQRIGAGAVPLAIILSGAALHVVSFRDDRRDLIYLTIIRLIALPLVTAGVLRLLPIAADVYQIAVIVAVMPVAVTTSLLTRRFGGSPQFAAGAAVITTLISVLTVPLAVALFVGV